MPKHTNREADDSRAFQHAGSVHPTSSQRPHPTYRSSSYNGNHPRHAPSKKVPSPRTPNQRDAGLTTEHLTTESEVGGERAFQEHRPACFDRLDGDGRIGQGIGPRRRFSRTFDSPRKRVALLVPLVLVIVMVLGALGYQAAHVGVIYRGVSVAGINLSGMTVEQATQTLDEQLGPLISNQNVVLYATDDAKAAASSTSSTIAASTSTDAVSAAQAVVDASDGTSWTVSASSVGASLDASGLAQEAYSVGRGADGFLQVLGAMFKGVDLSPRMVYDSSLLTQLTDALSGVAGTSMVDANISITAGVATVLDGNDGVAVDTDVFTDDLTTTFLGTDRGFVLPLETVPQNIDADEAFTVASDVTSALAKSVTLTYETSTWTLDATTMGSWVVTTVNGTGDGATLVPSIDVSAGSAGLTAILGNAVGTPAVNATFSFSTDGTVDISDSQTGVGPDLDAAMGNLQSILFGGSSGDREIALTTTEVQPTLTTEEAKSYGITTQLASFTTTFSSGSARTNNINVAADYINGSLISPDGTWSFWDTIGDATLARGFQSAGALVDGQHVDALGGGLCQVATTVFNAAYDAGLPIVERYCHAQYISTYPTGRDAAVWYSSNDLKFSNDTGHWLYVQATATNYSITITIWGTSDGRTVQTDTGDWVEGDAYTTTTVVDSSEPVGYSAVTTQGVNGSAITVTRTVYNADGSTRRTGTFKSSYSPVTEVITTGPAAATTSTNTSTTTSP